MNASRSYNYLAFGLLLLFLLAGAYLRLAAWFAGPLEGDQSILISIAMRFTNRGWEAFPLAANKSSAGIMNPPLIEYLYILPLLFSQSLRALHWFQAGLSLAAVVLLYFYAMPLFGRRVALLAALFFTAAPWAVYYGRFIWNPNPIPLFATLALIGLLASLAAGRSPWHLAGALVGLTAVTQLHLSGLVLIPITGLCLLLFWPQWLRPTARPGILALAAGGLLALLLYYPFFLFQRAVGFADLRLIQSTLLGGGESEAQFNMASLLLNWDLASGHGYIEAMGLAGQLAPPLIWLPRLMQTLMALTLVYISLRPLLAMWQQRRWPHQLSQRDKSYLILTLWISIPILLYLRHTVHLQNYYFLYLYPAPFLALALLADDVWRRLQPRWGQAAWLLFLPLALLAAGQFYVSHVRVTALQAGQNLPGRTVAQVEQAITAGRQSLQAYPDCSFIVVAEGDALETSSLGLLEDFLYPTPVRFIDSGRGYIEPAGCTLYLNATGDRLVADWLQTTAVPLPYTIQSNGSEIPFYYVAAAETAVSDLDALAHWQNGLILGHSHLAGEIAPQSQLTLTYEWLVAERTNDRTQYHFFNHLLNDAGELVAQEDTPAINARYWRAGDRLVTQFYLTLPPELSGGQYTLLIGLYSWPDLQRVPIIAGRNGDVDVYEVTTWYLED
jgi:4-amino-4-deoxy-L-arabinose transferase-like glycosyltransferase